MKIYHNARCSKSREALAVIQEAGKEVEIIEYLKEPFTKAELTKVIALLGLKPIQIIRKGEKDFKENFKGMALSDEGWIDAMLKYPKLIERPIVVNKKKAILARPAAKVKTLF